MSMQVTKKMTTKTTVTKTTQQGGGPPVTESHSSRKVSIASGSGSFLDTFGGNLQLEGGSSGVDMQSEIERIKKEMFNMKALEPAGSSTEVIKLDKGSLQNFVSGQDRNKLRLNLDVKGIKSETLNVKTVGNKVEVHGEKVSKTADGENKEEFSRTFELPSPLSPTEAGNVKSKMFQDGVLTVELPIPADSLK